MPVYRGPRSGGAAAAPSGRLTFASDLQLTVVLGAAAGDKALPSVTIPAGAIPSDSSISRVLAAISYRKSVESSSAPNAIDGAGQAVQVRVDTPGTWRDAIDTPNDSFPHAADATEAGYMQIGDNDIAVEVTGAGTYEFQWNDAEVDGDSLTFYDVQTYLIVEYD